MKKINLLDTTLRDGSYTNNFTFTASDTSIICKKLEDAGVKFIEIGHGLGLNASNTGHGKATETDEAYLNAARDVLKNAKFGMFCIPGIAKVENIDSVSELGMNFIRIGTDVTKINQSKEFIKRAKDYGIFVAANYMKSYALEPQKFAEKVKLSEKYGADMIYVVDSAGGMFSDDVTSYYDAIRKISDIPLGFHGHDNLRMAISNSLAAAESGFEYIDGSLQGLGRSSGNAPIEILVASLRKKGFEIGVDLLKLLDLGWNYVQPLIQSKGFPPLDIIAGYADFHSSYMPKILQYAAKYNVEPSILIIEMAKINRVDIDEKILEKIAQKNHSTKNVYTAKYGLNRYVGREQEY